MRHIPARLRRLVLRRSGGRCEYCRLSQVGQEATFHVDHVKPVASGGETFFHNLALACVSCSLRKGSIQEAVDPTTGQMVVIFNPRHDLWPEHFRWEGVHLIGLSPTGRATVKRLDLNRPIILSIRLEEAALGRHP
jgi:hypothetical protein